MLLFVEYFCVVKNGTILMNDGVIKKTWNKKSYYMGKKTKLNNKKNKFIE